MKRALMMSAGLSLLRCARTFLGVDGRQYVVIAAGGDGKAFGKSDEIIAFALPRGR